MRQAQLARGATLGHTGKLRLPMAPFFNGLLRVVNFGLVSIEREGLYYRTR